MVDAALVLLRSAPPIVTDSRRRNPNTSRLEPLHHEHDHRVHPLPHRTGGPARVRTLGRELAIMAETDLTDLLPHVAVPTLLLWGASDARSPLTVAWKFENAFLTQSSP